MDFLRSRRRALGLTREELGARAGVDARTIQRCERSRTDGNSYRASMETLARLAVVLEANVHELTQSAAVVERQLEQQCLTPPPPDLWRGRTGELQRAIATLTGDDPSPCCIAGPSGMGKTALAQLVARHVADERAHRVIWLVASHQGRSVDVFEAHARIAAGLGFQQRLPRPGTVDAHTRIRAFVRELWAHPCLLILDDVLDAELVAHFLPAHRAAPVIITTQLMHVAERFGEHTIELQGLAMEDTRQILGDQLGMHRVQTDRRGVEDLHEALGGLPQSIRIAARTLQRERLVDIGEYAGRLGKDLADGQYLPALREQETSFSASFARVRQHVPPAAWALLGALSFYGKAPFTLEWAAVAGGCESTGTAARLLSELIDVYLVDELNAGASTKARWFRLGAHVSVLARTISGDRRAAEFEHAARHAVATARTVDA